MIDDREAGKRLKTLSNATEGLDSEFFNTIGREPSLMTGQ
jgi:hypothetical protein